MKYALISVTDKIGISEFAKKLHELGFEILASRGTKKFLEKEGISCQSIEELTQFPEILSGRVKTLHPKIAGGILADRGNPSHLEELKKLDIPLIDIVVCNLYSFEEKPGIENIDIGGITLIRSAAKNYKYVTCITSKDQYPIVLDELKKYGSIREKTRLNFAKEAFLLTSRFDSLITQFLGKGILNLTYQKVSDLRYGENPHQQASLYRKNSYKGLSLTSAIQLQGKELSFNNLYDLDTALSVIKSFTKPCACVLKHANPCGVAIGKNGLDAYKKAHSGDPLSSFGGIVGVNQKVDEKLASEITKTFIEALLAPAYTKEALELLKNKKNMRVLELPLNKELSSETLKWINGGILFQDNDIIEDNSAEWKVVTKRQPSKEEFEAAKFAFKVVRLTKSNSICIATANQTIGIGVGQPNRVGALEIAVNNMKIFGFTPQKAALASDGFFPFRDSIDLSYKAGIKCVVEPGGSIRDKEVIEACDEHNIAMLFTHIRHFRH
ncbi:bifunctional phosphoribosylaminoimidazolecarboxamide formyltransferase/IMP cyclohydrolase [candidate division WOR-3 bacterium]|nr:bifunctional phosphoribosylaminoimidazolecarboxamide formyltransferase/IMP cyclohydrolase [candidate division WOR-3 bacterium]